MSDCEITLRDSELAQRITEAVAEALAVLPTYFEIEYRWSDDENWYPLRDRHDQPYRYSTRKSAQKYLDAPRNQIQPGRQHQIVKVIYSREVV